MQVEQYPDTATIPGTPGESTLINGVWEPSTPVQDIIQKGRYEPSTLNREIQLTDGNMAKVKGIFYMSLSGPNVDAGADFKIVDNSGHLILKTKVLFFTRGQLNCRVYL